MSSSVEITFESSDLALPDSPPYPSYLNGVPLVQAPRRAQFLAVLAVLVIGSFLAGCGGGSGDNAKALLKRGFSESIPSANVSVDVNVSVQGLPQLSQPIRVHIGGPYRSNGRGRLPSLQWGL